MFLFSQEGILQNREEDPHVKPSSRLGAEEEEEEAAPINAFADIQPLDDLGLRRKSLQGSTPTGSQSSSQRGSRSVLE